MRMSLIKGKTFHTRLHPESVLEQKFKTKNVSNFISGQPKAKNAMKNTLPSRFVSMHQKCSGVVNERGFLSTQSLGGGKNEKKENVR